MAAAKISRNEKVRLKGKQKKSGFDRWRLVVSGISSMTGAEKTFLLEFYLLNPILSPDEPVLGFKNRLSNDGKDLQFILAGSDGAKNSSSQEFVVPSFLMIRAGILTDRTIINVQMLTMFQRVSLFPWTRKSTRNAFLGKTILKVLSV